MHNVCIYRICMQTLYSQKPANPPYRRCKLSRPEVHEHLEVALGICEAWARGVTGLERLGDLPISACPWANP